jgi:CHAD domain-containing protein
MELCFKLSHERRSILLSDIVKMILNGQELNPKKRPDKVYRKNLWHDLAKVAKEPKYTETFKSIYPKKYHKYVESIGDSRTKK